MENQIIKMSHIVTINMLENRIDGNQSSFEYLDKMDIENLELLRDELVIEYNQTINNRIKETKNVLCMD